MENVADIVVTDGYLGGGAVYGSKSGLGLYGADLAKAIRADLKTAGIKGVTIASRNGNIQATVRTTAADLVSEADFIRTYTVRGAAWIDYLDDNGGHHCIHVQDFYALPAAEQDTIRVAAARNEYLRDYSRATTINHYRLDSYTGFSPAGLARLKIVRQIIDAYRYDESNSMVDYFDTNFFVTFYVKPANA